MKTFLMAGFAALLLAVGGIVFVPQPARAESAATALGSVKGFRSAEDRAVDRLWAESTENARKGGYGQTAYITTNTAIAEQSNYTYNNGPQTTQTSLNIANSNEFSSTNNVGANSQGVTITANGGATQSSMGSPQSAGAQSTVPPQTDTTTATNAGKQ